MFKDKVVMIVDGSGIMGTKLCFLLLQRFPELKKILIYSPNKTEQAKAKNLLKNNPKVSYYLGNIQQRRRLTWAMKGVDYVINIWDYGVTTDYSVAELFRLYLNGIENLIRAATARRVAKVLSLSSYQACNPVDTEGTARLCTEKLILAANQPNQGQRGKTLFSILRYGEAFNNPEGIIKQMKKQAESGCLTLEDVNSTRFWFTIDHGVASLIKAISTMRGGEIFVPQVPSLRIMDLVKIIGPQCQIKLTGIKPGNKLHELLISQEEGVRTLELPDYYVIQPTGDWWEKAEFQTDTQGRELAEGFSYSSANNYNTLSPEELTLLMPR